MQSPALSPALSLAEQRQISTLFAAGAHSEAEAKSPYERFMQGATNPGVLARLAAKGLTGSKPYRRHGHAWTLYWLTEAGLTAAGALEAGTRP